MEERDRDKFYRELSDEVSLTVSVIGICLAGLIYKYGLPSWNDISAEIDAMIMSPTPAITQRSNHLVPTKQPPTTCLKPRPTPSLMPMNGRIFELSVPNCQGKKLIYQRCY